MLNFSRNMLAVTEAPVMSQKTAKRVNKPDQTTYERVRLPATSPADWLIPLQTLADFNAKISDLQVQLVRFPSFCYVDLQF